MDLAMMEMVSTHTMMLPQAPATSSWRMVGSMDSGNTAPSAAHRGRRARGQVAGSGYLTLPCIPTTQQPAPIATGIARAPIRQPLQLEMKPTLLPLNTH